MTGWDRMRHLCGSPSMGYREPMLIVRMQELTVRSLGYESGIKMAEPERLSDLVEALMAKDYSAASLSKILGGNLLRIAVDGLEIGHALH
jgi:hypothetical protein